MSTDDKSDKPAKKTAAAAKKVEPKISKLTARGREENEAARTEQPDMTAVDEARTVEGARNGGAPAQVEGDGWGDVPVQMRGE